MVFERVKKYFVFLNLSDRELMSMVDKTFDKSKTEDENFNKVLSIFFALVREEYKKGDISLILLANKFYYDDISKAINSLNNFALFLQDCDIKFDSELENKIMKCTLDLDKTIKKITLDGNNNLTELNKAAVNLINSSNHSFFNTSESEKNLEYLLEEVDYGVDDEVEAADDNYEEIISEVSFCDNPTKQYFLELGRIPKLSEEEEKTLYKKYKETKDVKIRNRIIEGNLRLIIPVAREFAKLHTSFTLLDLIAYGTEGLFRALEDYDPEKAKFSTYATWWIRQKISKKIQDDPEPIRIPANLKQKLFRYNRKKSDLEMRYGRKLSIEELSEKIGLSAKTINHYDELLLVINGSVSMESPIGDEEGSKVKDFIPDSNNMTPEQAAIFNDMTNVNYLLSQLTEVEKMVVLLRSKLYDGRYYNLEKVRDKIYQLGLTDTMLTVQRMQQIESKAFKKLRKIVGVNSAHPNYETIVINRSKDKNNEELKKISREFLKLIKLIKITDVTVLSKSISELSHSYVRVLRSCFGENIFSGVPLDPSIDVKREAAFVVFPELKRIIIKNETKQRKLEKEEFSLPRNLYQYFIENTRYDVDKAIAELSSRDRLYLSKCYNFYTGNFKISNRSSYNDRKCIFMILKNIEFNLPKGKNKKKIKD